MTRIHVICEGQTEELFVKEILTKEFSVKGIYLIPALLGKPGHKGGNMRFARILTDIKNRLVSDRASYCTTFFDYYGLPADFPGKAEAEAANSIEEKARLLQKEFVEKLGEAFGQESSLRRFIPYVQMYEFEGLLFSEPKLLANSFNRPELQMTLSKIRSEFQTPEDINNSSDTAPSKRIIKLVPEYEKPINGCLAALEIGLLNIRTQCKLFNSWLNTLEQLEELVL